MSIIPRRVIYTPQTSEVISSSLLSIIQALLEARGFLNCVDLIWQGILRVVPLKHVHYTLSKQYMDTVCVSVCARM